MKSLFRGLIVVCLSVILVVSLAYAQDSTPTDSDSATVNVNTTVPITATMDIVVNGKIVQVSMPANLSIDSLISITQESLANAKPLDNKVGSLTWEILEIKDYGKDIKLENHDPIQSVTGKFIGVSVDVTNLDNADVDMGYSSAVEIKGIDARGHLYKPSDENAYFSKCATINPGITDTCGYLFEVPDSVNIVGLDIVAKDHGKIVAK
ncbi:hypothetical protein BH10CHL1_BH10CHL1_04780 [soil metagenome]